MSAKHTPGPWHIHAPRANSLQHIRNAEGVYVMDAPVRNGKSHAAVRQIADAWLIAAAPDMLAELREILSWARVEQAPLRQQEIDSIKRVIAKATGEAA